jgi:CRISPR/Cas system-associated endonuclease/helicase Cas3
MDIVEQMRSFESDHEPGGWPAVTMGQISALCDEIERLQSIIDELQKRFMDASVDRNLLQGVINEQQSPAVAISKTENTTRITEHEARIIVESAIHHYIFSDKGANIDNWLEDEGRNLIAKLNEAKHD